MKRLISVILSAAFVFTAISISSYSLSSSDVSARAAALIVASTGEVIFEKNAYEHLPMASTTKIMTALLTIEQGTPNREVKVTEDMVKVEGSSMGILPDDTVSFYSLECGMLLESGNDAANVAAISIAGSDEKFAVLMNKRAKEIGMSNTNFVTPSGLDDENHYSCAHDMALLGAESIKNSTFLSICSQRNISVSYGNPPYLRMMSNHNRLLSSYDGAIGIKTGFTKKSGRCLVSAAERDGVTLIAVTLNAPNDWADHTKMLDYGFSVVKKQMLDDNFSDVILKVVGGNAYCTGVKSACVPYVVSSQNLTGITREVYLKQFEYAPIEENTVVGEADYYCKGKLICKTDLVANGNVDIKENTTVKQEEKKSFFEKIKEFFRR